MRKPKARGDPRLRELEEEIATDEEDRNSSADLGQDESGLERLVKAIVSSA